MAPSRRGTRSGSVGGAATEPGKKEREDGDAVARMGGTGASILREGSSKRMADALLDEESASFCKRSRSLPEELEDGQLAGDALKRLGSESGSVGGNMSHHDHGEGSADGRSRRAGDDDEDAQEHEEKQEAEEDDMEEDEEEAEDDEGEADIEEVVKDDAVGREDEGFENQKEEVGEHKMDGDRGEECPEPPKDDEPKEEGKEETREEVRDDVVAVAIGVAAEAEKVAALGMSEEKLVEKELSVQDLIDKKDELDAHSQVAAPIQLQVTLSAQQSLSLSLEHKPEEKKENGSVEQKLAELPNGLQKLDEIHAVAPKQVHIHHMQHHQAPHPHQAPPQQLAPKPPPSVWGAHMGGSGGGPSFATMLASTNTFAAMLQTGLSPPANQQPISIKLAGTNAFSAVLAAGTFSSVLAQGQDGKDKGRCSTGGDKDDGSPDKSGIDKGEEGEEGEHKADRKAEDGQDHEQSLQAHVTEVHAGDVQPSQDDVQIDPQLEQQGEPPQIDADGHVEGEAHGEAEVEAPSEGEGQGDIKTEYVHVHGAEAHHVDGEEARRHAEIEAEVAGQEATDMTDMTEVHDVGQHDVDQQGEHPSASHVDLSHHDEGAEHKEGVVDEGGESEQETGVEEDLDAEAQAGISVDPHGSTMDPHGISVDPHAEPVPEDPEEPAMETGSDVGAETEVPPDASDEGADHQVDQSMDDTYPAPGSESGDTLGMPGEGMGTYVGVGT